MKASEPLSLASYRPRLIGIKDDNVILYSRPFNGNKTSAAIKLLTGLNAQFERNFSLTLTPVSAIQDDCIFFKFARLNIFSTVSAFY